MSENDNEELDSQNQATEEVDNTEEVEEVTGTESEETEDLEAIKEKNRKLFERAKKAEAEAKRLKEAVKPAEPVKKEPVKDSNLTAMDTIALIDAKVTNREDIEEVLDYAKHKGLSVSEALKTTVVKTILKENAEIRTSAEAASSGPARRGSGKVSDDQILQNAASGKLPDDVEALARARMNKLKNK